ncbi:hypothetical protein Aperf_G00000109533 [Anoplocephala perfoliata]
MEITEDSENVTPPTGKSPDKQVIEEPKEPNLPGTEINTEKPTGEVTKVDKRSSDEVKQSAKESKSQSIIETPTPSGDSEARQPRARKQVQRWSEVLSKTFTEEQEAKEKALDAQLAKGSGTALGEIPLIESSIRKSKPVDLKLLHFACFGRAGAASEVRSNLRKFNGFPFDVKSPEYMKREAGLMKKPVKEIQESLRQLHLEVSGTRPQTVTRLLEFLLKPDASVVKFKGKLPPSKRKSVRGRKSRKADSEESGSKSSAPSGRKSKKISKESGEEGSDELGGLSEAEETSERDEGKGGGAEEEAGSEKSENPSDDDYAPEAKKGDKGAASRKRKAPTKVAKSSARKTKRRRTKVIESESEEEELAESGDSGGAERGDEEEEEKTKSSDEKSKEGSDGGDDDDDDKPLAKVTSKSEEEPGEATSTGAGTSEPSASSVPFPSDGELREKTVELLREANLNEVSMKVIRQSLAEKYPGLDLSSKKDFLNGVIKEFLATSI